MRSRKTRYSLMAAAFLVVLLGPTLARAQSDPRDETFQRLVEAEKKMGPGAAYVSGGGRGLFHLADQWNRMKVRAKEGRPRSADRAMISNAISAPPDLNQSVSGLPSRLRSFTANESSTAWCGNNVAVGFNDTESIPETNFPDRGGSTLGYSISNNKGASFTDQGFPTVGSDPSSSMGFDQIFACSSPTNFYFSTLYNSSNQTGVSFSTSVDGGKTFGQPVIAASASNMGHFFDGDWMAVDLNNPQRIFITYTDDDTTGTVCPTALGTSIELVHSDNGGNTWSSPITVAPEVCFDASSPNKGIVEFSGIAVDPRGTRVYVSWESFVPGSFDRQVNIASAAIPITPGSLSFGAPNKVSSVNYVGTFDGQDFTPGGNSFFEGLQGRIIDYEHPSLAIGKGQKNNGVLYVAWNDGTDPIVDVHSLFGVYRFADIVMTSSSDGGNTWTTPVKVNDDIEDGSAQHPFTDQFMPAVATDKDGTVAVCFYDRRDDPLNFLIGRTCAKSDDAGKHWNNMPTQQPGSPPEVNQDDFALHDWRGDYDTLTSDSTNMSGGFLGGYTDTSGGYQRVLKNKF